MYNSESGPKSMVKIWSHGGAEIVVPHSSRAAPQNAQKESKSTSAHPQQQQARTASNTNLNQAMQRIRIGIQ